MTDPEIITRKEARARGLKRYFTGEPCEHGHRSKRYVTTRICVECNRERARADYAANPEKFRERQRKWQAANPDKVREHQRKWQAANRDKVNEQKRKWRMANPEKYREHVRKWQAANRDKVNEQERKRYAAKRKIKAAILSLDPENDAHWVVTGARIGEPRVAAIAAAIPDGQIKMAMTRDHVSGAIPGWNRDKAMNKLLSEVFPY